MQRLLAACRRRRPRSSTAVASSLCARSRARSSRRDPIADRPRRRRRIQQKEQPPARPDARPQFTGPPPMDKVWPETQSEHTPETLCARSRARSSRRDPIADRPRRRRRIQQKEQPPARPDARPQFTGPPPMDKVWPETQSEHTPETLCARSRGRSSRRDPIADRPRRAAEFSKKNNRRPGPTLGHNSPDRRQWIKSGPKLRASTRRRERRLGSESR